MYYYLELNKSLKHKNESNIEPLFDPKYWPNIKYFLNIETRPSYLPKFDFYVSYFDILQKGVNYWFPAFCDQSPASECSKILVLPKITWEVETHNTTILAIFVEH